MERHKTCKEYGRVYKRSQNAEGEKLHKADIHYVILLENRSEKRIKSKEMVEYAHQKLEHKIYHCVNDGFGGG